jgi:hypothetical protein
MFVTRFYYIQITIHYSIHLAQVGASGGWVAGNFLTECLLASKEGLHSVEFVILSSIFSLALNVNFGIDMSIMRDFRFPLR